MKNISFTLDLVNDSKLKRNIFVNFNEYSEKSFGKRLRIQSFISMYQNRNVGFEMTLNRTNAV